MNHSACLETERLKLIGITPAVVRSLFETKNSEEIREFFQIAQEEFDSLKEMNEKGMETFRISLYYFLLQDRNSGEILGECGFHTWYPAHHRADIFYKLRKDESMNRGLMTEALRKVLKFGFEVMKLHRVQALVAYDNVPSLRLLDRFGFKKEGIARQDYLVDGVFEDSECYSLIRPEWNY